MPHITGTELEALPNSVRLLLRRLLFIDPPWTEAGASWGTSEQVQEAAVFLNVPDYAPPPGVAPSASNIRVIALSFRAKTSIIRLYSRFLAILISAGLVAFLLCSGIFLKRRVCTPGLLIAFVAWITIVLRLLVLALIDVSSFPTIFDAYISFAFPLSCFAPLVSLFIFGDVLSNFIVLKRTESQIPSSVGRRSGPAGVSHHENISTMGRDNIS